MPYRLPVAALAALLLVISVRPMPAHGQDGLERVGRWGEGPSYSVEVAEDHAYYGLGGYLVVADVADPAEPTELGRVLLPGVVRGVAVAGDYVYVAAWDGGFHVVDVSVPAQPSLVSTLEPPHAHYVLLDVTVTGDTAYVSFRWSGWFNGGFYVVDISDPVDPRVRYDVQGMQHGVAVHDGYVYAAGRSPSFTVYRDSTEVGVPPSYSGCAEGIQVQGGRVFLATCSEGLEIFDVNDPTQPRSVASVDIDPEDVGYRSLGVTVDGDFAYVASDGPDGRLQRDSSFAYDFGHLAIVDVGDVASPVTVGELEMAGDPHDVEVQGGHAYVAGGPAGLVVLDVTDVTQPALLARLQATEGLRIGGAVENRVYLYSDSTIHVVDVTEPGRPNRTNTISTQGRIEDVTMADGRLLAVSRESPIDVTRVLEVFDVAEPDEPTLTGSASSDVGGQTGLRVAVSSGTAFVGGDYGLQAVNTADPGRAQEVTDVAFGNVNLVATGDYLYGLSQRCSPIEPCTVLDVLDVSQVSNPVSQGEVRLRPYTTSLAVDGAFVYIVELGPWPIDGSRRTVLRVVEHHGSELSAVDTLRLPPSWFDPSQFDVAVAAGAAYVSAAGSSDERGEGAALYALDLADPRAPALVDSLGLPIDVIDIEAAGDRVYVSTEARGLFVFQNHAVDTAVETGPDHRARQVTSRPNPFSDRARITFSLDRPQHVRLTVYDVTGRRVATLVDGRKRAGTHAAEFDAAGLASGVYVYQFHTSEDVVAGTMLLVK